METTKRLQRDTQHKVIGGVCSGLANYLGIDAALIRVMFAVALLAFSSGLWLYLILWLVMPEAKPGEAQNFAETQDLTVVENNRSSWITGLVLIFIGVCLLLGNLIPQFNWRTFWPVLIIILGLVLIIPHKSNKP